MPGRVGQPGTDKDFPVEHDRFPSPAPLAAAIQTRREGDLRPDHRLGPTMVSTLLPAMPPQRAHLGQPSEAARPSVREPMPPEPEHAPQALGSRTQRACGPLPFLIQRDGSWLYQGTPIRRKPMVCLFASVIRRDAAGRYRLETPMERGEIEVEDVPFVAVELDWTGCGRDQVLSFRTNVDEIVCAGPDHPLEIDWECVRSGGDCAAIPYLTVRPGDGALPIQARVARAVYYELAALAVEGTRHGVPCLGVWSRNRFFPIGPLGPAACHPD